MNVQTMTPEALFAADTIARETALDPTRSFIIDAPAGAGKTELLTQRFLLLLSRVDEPEEIIALTFTNKAAAEMRDRIMQSLVGATAPLDSKALPHKQATYRLACAVLERDAQRRWQLLQQPGRLRVMTLDALSARIARQMPLLSRFGTQPTIASDAAPFYEQAARNTLDQLEDGTPESETVARALAYFDNDGSRLQRMLVSMLARRDQWLKHAYDTNPASLQIDVGNVLRELVAHRLGEITRRIPASRQQVFMGAARYAAALSPESPIHILADWQAPLDADPENLPQWRGVADLFLTGKNELRKTYQKPINLAGATHQAQKQILLDAIADFTATGDAATLADIRALPDPQLGDDEAEIVSHLATLLRLAYAQLWLVFIREKAVDFGEISSRAWAALGDEEAPSEIRERLDYRIRHLLVDEFQDTSPLQVELLERLTAGWEDDPARSVFLVGDPMQSIYRFRKADVGLFLRVRQRGLGKLRPEHLQLYLNNRSYAPIIDWVNQTFVNVFAPADDVMAGAVTYAPSVPNRGNSSHASVSIHPIINGDRDPETGDSAPKSLADEREAAAIVDLIRNARAENPDGTVAILVRARSHLDALVAQLQQITPPLAFQAIEIDALGERQAVQDLVSLTRALHHRADRIHWLSILRAPWCGLKLEDLHRLAGDDHQQTLWALMQDEARINRLSDDGRARLLPLRHAFADAYANQGMQRPRRWVEGVWHAIGGPSCLSSPNDVNDASAYFQLLDDIDDRGALDLSCLDDALARLFAAPDPDPESRHIQLMTIHKSKGLEFDTVILPSLHRTPPPNEKALLLWDNSLLDTDNREHLVVAPAPPPGKADSTIPTPYDLLRALERTRAQNEDKRVLYVAVTRAIRRLHLLGVASRDRKSDDVAALKAPAATSLLAPLWPALQSEFIKASHEPETALPQTGRLDPANFVPKLVRVISPPAWATSIDENVIDEDAESTSPLSDSTLDMDIGTLVHRYLEIIAQDGLEAWHDQRIGTLRPRFESYFLELGHDTADATEAADIVHATLQNAILNDTSRWILSPHESAGCEVPLSSIVSPTNVHADEASGFQHHVIDRTFISEGARWIIDYKTLRLAPESDIEAMLQAKAESYRPQLERYAALYAHEAERGIAIRTAIFFPAHDKLIEIEP